MAKAKGKAEVERRAAALQRLRVEYVPAASVKPNSYNPNRQGDNEFLLLCRSMQEDGFTQPIVVYEKTREVVDGEHRWTAAIVLEALRRAESKVTEESTKAARAQRLALVASMPDFELPVVFVDMTAEQMRVATLRHNRARGTEDYELTGQLLRDLEKLGALDFAQDALQLSEMELQRMIEDVPVTQALAAEAFTQAWEPVSKDAVSAEQEGGAYESGKAGVVSMTPAAIEAVRKREQALREAMTDEDRKKARAEAEVFRVVCVFAGEEARVVREVLGDAQAAGVLALCRAEHMRSAVVG